MTVAGKRSQSSVAKACDGHDHRTQVTGNNVGINHRFANAHWAEETSIDKGLTSTVGMLFITDDKAAVSKPCL